MIVNGYATKPDFLIYIQSIATGTTSEELARIANDDTQIDDLLTSASRIIDTYTGREFFLTTGTYYYDTPNGRELFFDRDITSVISVTNGDGSVIDPSNYNLLPLNYSPKYAIELKPGSNIYWSEDNNGNTRGVISIVAVSGINAIPAQIKTACLLLAVSLYRQRNGESPIEGGFITPQGNRIFPVGLPKTAMQLLAPFVRAEILGI